MELNQQQIENVSAGSVKNIIEAVGMAVQVYEGTAFIFDASQSSLVQSTAIYVNLGHQIGEQVFNITHPNPLGQMVYTANDFTI
ncbi:MAG: hypothetical protein JSR17_13465 [Proteobacteria bacterium]|nr:hypothetical protein [Pseudomonadota bacterium]